jgi:transcriptional regulator with XRE-family HTH domain
VSARPGRLTHEEARAAGARIRGLRRDRGWKQLDLALKAGVSQSTVCNAERGSTGTGAGVLAAIAGAFGLVAADLRGECPRCEPRPGAGFTCLACGAEAVPR